MAVVDSSQNSTILLVITLICSGNKIISKEVMWNIITKISVSCLLSKTIVLYCHYLYLSI